MDTPLTPVSNDIGELDCTLCRQLYRVKSQWVSVAERLPEENQRVMIYTDYKNILIGKLLKEAMWVTDNASFGLAMECVPHWQPLPEGPEVGG
jgi:hypothetical protein